MSQLGWVNSRNKLQGQKKKSPWNSGERKAKEMCLGVGGSGWGEGEGQGTDVLPRRRMHPHVKF